MDRLVRVVVKPAGRSAAVSPGTNLLQLVTKLDLDFTLHCGGKGKCGKCKVVIEEGSANLDPYTETELELLSVQERQEGYRLACRTAVPATSGLAIRIPRVSRAHQARLQVEGIPASVTPDPMVRKYLVRMPTAAPGDSRADEDKLLAALKERYSLNCQLLFNAALELSSAIEGGDSVVTAVVWDGQLVISVEAGDTTSQNLGFAADIGTTKLAGYLMDLNTGKQLATSSRINPQALYGEDVMSRIAFSMADPDNLAILQKTVLEGIKQLIKDCCKQAGANPRWLYDACLVGNTCMTHLLLGLSPKSLALSPYHPVVRKGIDIEAGKLPVRLPMNPNGRLHVLPVIAGFVGADNVAVQLATGRMEPDKVRLVLDIGTNTEVVLSDSRGSLVCSCASGPAFEGMHITYGRQADLGSIEKVRIDPKTFEVTLTTIGGTEPVGICGSGIIDAVAEMLKAGIIDHRGRLNEGLVARTPRMRQGPSGEAEFVLAWKEETSVNTDIYVNQSDVNEIQKAKAAIHAGCTRLMAKKGITESAIDELIIAGAFGQYMDKASARTLGLFPEVPLDRIKDVGNAAGTGAKLALLSRAERQKAEDISDNASYYELATDPDFVREYASSMFFPYIDLSRYPETKKLLPFIA